MRRLFDYRTVSREKRTHILAAMLFGSVLCYYLLVHFIVMFAEVEGTSMLPALRDGDRFLVNRLVYRFREPRAGDIVEFKTPRMKDYSVKRIIGIPGDVVQIRDGGVYVNGKLVREPYLARGVLTEGLALAQNSYRVSEGAYFVLGDNRAQSVDSRMFGAVPRGDLIGKLWSR